jgi:transcriptional regulator GlxA family with amidase domain
MQIAMYIYDGVTALDVVGPYEVLNKLPNVNIMFVAQEKGIVETDSKFLKFTATHTMQEVSTADILVVPGATINFIKEASNKNVLAWIRTIAAHATYIFSVCSGSIILGAAELLAQKKATTHWAVMNLLKEYKAIPTTERVVVQDNIIMAAGVSAGIDGALLLVEKIVGVDEAKKYQLMIEYAPEPHLQSGSIQQATPETIKAAKRELLSSAQKELHVMDLLKYAPLLLKLK